MSSERASFSELAATGRLIFGDGYRTKASELGQPGYPILRVAQVADGRVTSDGVRDWVKAEFGARVPAKLSQEGDVVLTTKGTLGRRARIDASATGWIYSPQVCYFRVRDTSLIDPGYLYSWLGSNDFLNQARGRASQTDMADYLSLRDLGTIQLPLPSIGEQRAIAHILGTLDNKIELNRRMSETAEAIARALFNSWFVDFDPVRAKVEGRDPGLPPAIAALIPDAFEESELGELPTGWGLGRFGDVVEQLRDQEQPLASPDALYQHFSLPAFDEGQYPKAEYGATIKSQKWRVPAGAVLLSKLNPEIERVWLTDVRPDERAVCSTEFLVLNARLPFTPSFAYCAARSPIFRKQIEGLVTGTSKSHQRAQADSVLNLELVRPPSAVIAAFDRSAEALLRRSLACRREARTLAALRDTLLPKLISGALRVADTQRLLEGTAE